MIRLSLLLISFHIATAGFCQEPRPQQVLELMYRIAQGGGSCKSQDWANILDSGRGFNAALLQVLGWQDAGAYDDGQFSTPAGTFLQDAYWCNHAGLAKTPKEASTIYSNHTAVLEYGELLGSKYQSIIDAYPANQTDGAEDQLTKVLEDSRKVRTPEDRANYLETHEAPHWADLKWAGLIRKGMATCMIEMCLWNYCQLPSVSGTKIGSCCQCNKHWHTISPKANVIYF